MLSTVPKHTSFSWTWHKIKVCLSASFFSEWAYGWSYAHSHMLVTCVQRADDSFAHARYMRAACRRLIHEGRQASACCMYVCVCVNEQKQPSTTMRSNRNSLRGTCTSLLYFVLKSCEGGGVVSLVSNTHAHIIRWHTRLSWELWSHDRTTSCSLWRYRNNPEYLYTLVK